VAYVSELLGKPVVDVDGKPIGRLKDLIANVRSDVPHPEVVALVVRRPHGSLIIPYTAVAVLVAPAIVLSKRAVEVEPYEPAPQSLYLARDVLDKQIIDVDGFRVVRVNDLELTRVNGHVFLANVDIGGRGLMRRVGLGRLASRLSARSGKGIASGEISWDAVDLLPGDQPMRLKVPSSKIKELDPADLAEILSDLSRGESSRLLESLDVRTVADTLEEVEPDFQASLIAAMPDERAAKILDAMAPDEATDLLTELPDERRQELLKLMEREEAEDVRRLLAYPEDTAGGIMNTEFVAVHPELTADQTVAVLRQTSSEAEIVYYVYVVDEGDHLIGVFSLRDLVLASPQTPVAELMHRRVVSISVRASQDEAAQEIAKYNLLAVPVVDDEDRLLGIVTADDALDKIIPTAWKKRLPRLYH
jgi:magnesium transporter